MRPRLFVPGWGGSGPDHWQSRWQGQMRGARRVEMPDWFAPDKARWLTTLDRAVANLTRDSGQRPIAIAHSLGCVAVAAWAETQRVPGLAGALLVAPSDVERADAAAVLREFGPVPSTRLPFPAHVVVSDDDPYVAVDRARAFAEAWGASLTILPGHGHINVASGHGDWPGGLDLLRQLALAPAA